MKKKVLLVEMERVIIRLEIYLMFWMLMRETI